MSGLRTLLPTRGYERASIAAIANAAGLASGLVHYHFRNKQEILVEVVAELSRDLMRRYERRASPGDPAWLRLDALIDAHLALGDDADAAAVACWVAVAAEAVRQPEVRVVFERAMRAVFEALRALLEEIMTQGSMGPARAGADEVAAIVLAVLQGAYLVAAAAPGLLPIGSAAPTLKLTVRGLLGTRAAPPSP